MKLGEIFIILVWVFFSSKISETRTWKINNLV
jgi:hypothetical protein